MSNGTFIIIVNVTKITVVTRKKKQQTHISNNKEKWSHFIIETMYR